MNSCRFTHKPYSSESASKAAKMLPCTTDDHGDWNE